MLFYHLLAWMDSILMSIYRAYLRALYTPTAERREVPTAASREGPKEFVLRSFLGTSTVLSRLHSDCNLRGKPAKLDKARALGVGNDVHIHSTHIGDKNIDRV